MAFILMNSCNSFLLYSTPCFIPLITFLNCGKIYITKMVEMASFTSVQLGGVRHVDTAVQTSLIFLIYFY